MEIEEIEKCIKELTNEKRFRHSKGVQKTAGELAKHYGLDVKKAELAGLMHDCTKNLPPEEMMKLCDKFGCALDDVSKLEHKLIHAPLGAYYSKNVFGIDDKEIFDAISCHTTAKANMTMFEKVLYIADVIEPNRVYDIADQLRKMAFEDIDRAILIVLNYTINKIITNGRMLHNETINARNYLISKGVKV
ncbi:MAG: bis(5'-nucleosyl)-tetraphosphatase (symmetrical) YqeK [Clostridia bacterium]|nr:bis(5'-nucleosyl)-tetraphosphatase (symmetrical) YqeK [Clostridia bacterium]